MNPNPLPPPEAGGIPLSRRTSRMTTSAVREILKVAERPDILSFAGGLPAPELFPVQEIAAAYADVLAREGQAALQYGVTEGFGPLREWIAHRLGARGVRAEAERLLITNGSQQGIDLAAKVLLDKGDRVIVESPSYLAALQAFSGFEARLVAVGSDEHGLRVDEVESALAERRTKLIYLVPDFQNPNGSTLSLERRRALVDLAQRYRVPILEDDPYGELRFRGERLPSLAALDDAGVVIQLGTFSKTLAPGLRIGWLLASRELLRPITVAKQASDLHSGTLTQRAVARLLEGFDYDGHLATLRAAYAERCDAMDAALRRHLPEGARWHRPDGGLFIWLQLPGGIAAEELLEDALRQKVAFVPGAPFFAQNARHDFARLNFSNRPPELIDEGMRRIGEALRARLAAFPADCARTAASARCATGT